MSLRIDLIEEGVLRLDIDRPDAGNRLDSETIDALTSQLEALHPLDGGPAVVIIGAVGEHFSLGRQRPGQQSADPIDIVEEFSRIQRLNTALQNCRAVTISAVQGKAEGAGLSLAARSDIVIVADDAQLSFPEIAHDIPPTIVLSHFRYTIPPNLLGDLIYAARVLRGTEAVGAGLAARSVPAGELQEVVLETARRIAGHDRRSIALVKEFLIRTRDMPSAQAPGLGISLYANEMSHRLLNG